MRALRSADHAWLAGDHGFPAPCLPERPQSFCHHVLKCNATALVYTSGTSGHFLTAKQRSFRVHSALLLPSYTSNGNERSGGDTE